ncbi:hypothetical protein QTJ16_000380 [Diplocarpon rosae]|uniref:Rhodopsin domain-containing protein n=1 Tax=Diplocarpon rosae TaxID=946125 RepID=A0AAD9T574_9HELO|nr:hypothetical protein QTJ16_000380 [Diplocarpon rosae]
MDPMISTALAGADRSTNAPSILAINGAFCGFAFTIVMVRMYARAMVLKAVGKDDWLILAAMDLEPVPALTLNFATCGIGVFACYVGECSNGKGMHSASIRPDEFVRILQWQFYHSVIVTVGISLTIIFSCLPIRASWDRASEPDAKCFSTSTFTYIGMSNSVVNILTDVLFASLPIPIVWNLQVNVRTKISLIVIMSLGYFACACSIVKTKIQATVFQDADSYRNDSYFVWNSLELYMGIVAASLPTLRALFNSVLDFRTFLKGSSNGQRKYYMHEEGIGMTPLSKGHPHHVKITTMGQGPPRAQVVRSISRQSMYGAPRGLSKEDFPIQGDSDSLDDILSTPGMRQSGITKTVHISVQR